MRVQGYEMRSVGEPLRLAERDEPPPPAGWVRVEVAACGVCHTDVGFLFDGVPTRKDPPLVLGHEIVGRVVELGEGTAEGLLGRDVIVPAVMPCGTCEACRRGRGDVCPRQVFPGNDVHGGFATHVDAPAHALVPLPPGRFEGDALRRLAVVADAVSTAFAAVRKSGLEAGDVAVFVGAGGVGGFGAQIAKAMGATVLCVDVDEQRLAGLRAVGVEATVDARDLDARGVRDRVRAIAKERGLPRAFWKVFETSGTPAGQRTAFQLLTHGAVLGVVGFTPKSVDVPLSRLMAFAARAEGTWGCPPDLFPEVLELLADGRVELEPFVEFFPMSEVNAVLERLHRGGSPRRPVLVPDFQGRR